MKSIKDIESVGWGFFLTLFVVLSPPCGYGTWAITDPAAAMLERVGLGVVGAALLAAIIAWGVNELLHRRNLRNYEAEKKVEKKKERKKKKRH